MNSLENSYLEEIKWDQNGLITAIAQDVVSHDILMVAWMNPEALTLTIQEQRAVYWSRSRQKLWRKGEESGHIQRLHNIYLDCDGDVLLLEVEQLGGIACHTGRKSCFFRQLKNNQWNTVAPVLKDPNKIYHKHASPKHKGKS
ncbi:MAG TPA: phosphoribosyl-AMP cyclohydrolase [Pseudomonadales bacterium]